MIGRWHSALLGNNAPLFIFYFLNMNSVGKSVEYYNGNKLVKKLKVETLSIHFLFIIIIYRPYLHVNNFPREGPGVKSRMCPPYPQRDRKRRLNRAACRNHRIKRVVPCRCLDGHVKEPYEMSMSLGARPLVQLLLQSACTSMCRHIYDWNIVNCDVKQLIQLNSIVHTSRHWKDGVWHHSVEREIQIFFSLELVT